MQVEGNRVTGQPSSQTGGSGGGGVAVLPMLQGGMVPGGVQVGRGVGIRYTAVFERFWIRRA